MLRNYDVIYYEQNSNSKAYFKNKMLLEIEPISDKGIKAFYKDFVEELKTSKPAKWYTMMKKLGGVDSKISEKVEVESLKGLTNKEAVEEVAKTFAAVSQSYQPIEASSPPSCRLEDQNQ